MDEETLNTLEKTAMYVFVMLIQLALEPTQEFPHNPNGSKNAIAGICDKSGRVFGLMPHPGSIYLTFQSSSLDSAED